MKRTLPIRSAIALVALALPFLGASPAAAEVSCDRVASPAPGAVSQLMDQLADGQTGCLQAGVYNEDVELFEGGAPGAPVTLRSVPGERAELKGRLLVGKGANHVVIEDLYLNGDNADRVPSPIIGGNDVVFRGNDITNHHTSICFVVGSSERAEWGRPQRPVIDSNKIHNCGALPAANHEHGIYVEATDDARITNNWIYDNADRGIQLYPDAQRVTISGNVIDGNGQGVIFSGDNGFASNDNVVQGNVITNSKLRYNVESWWPEGNPVGTGNTLKGNCVNGGAEDNSLGGIQTSQVGFKATDNLAQDPQYVDRGGKDFRLAEGSPCAAVLAGAGVPGPEGSASDAPPVAPKTGPTPRRCRFARTAGRPRVGLWISRSRAAAGQRVRLRVRVQGDCQTRRRVEISYRRGNSWRRFAKASVGRSGELVLNRRAPRSGARHVLFRARTAGSQSRTVRLALRG